MKKTSTKPLVLAFLLFVYLAVSHKTAAKKNQLKDVIKRALHATVLVMTYDVKGEPWRRAVVFFVSEKGEVITNSHVLKDAERAAVKCPDGSVYKITKIIAEDITSDLVKLQADNEGTKTPWLQLNKGFL